MRRTSRRLVLAGPAAPRGAFVAFVATAALAALATLAASASDGTGTPPAPPAGGASRAPGPAPPPADPAQATKPYSSGDGRFTLSLPAAWTVDRDAVGESVMSWKVAVPDVSGDVRIAVYHVPGLMNVRAQPYVERGVHPARYGVPGPAQVEMQPVPHLWLDTDQGARRHVWIYRVIRRNGLTLSVTCPPDAWMRLRPDVLRAHASLATTVEDWPPPPKGYRTVLRDGFCYRLHPAVADGDVNVVHRHLRDAEADFVRLHGPVWHPADCPVLVYLHAKAADAAPVDAEAAAASHGIHAAMKQVALFAVAPAKGDAAAEGDLAREARHVLLAQSFANELPYWEWCAEPVLAGAEASLRRSLPAVPEGLLDLRRAPTRTLADLSALSTVDRDTLDEMVAYLAFLRCGPRSWRDAYTAYLKESAATGDCTAAEKRHLLSLDQQKLRAAVAAWLPKGLDPVKRR